MWKPIESTMVNCLKNIKNICFFTFIYKYNTNLIFEHTIIIFPIFLCKPLTYFYVPSSHDDNDDDERALLYKQEVWG